MIFEITTAIVYIFVFVLGLVLGSYLNSWIWRIHEEKYVFMGRSICVHCGRELAWYENFPLFSFLVLRGKCRTCKGVIPVSYFLTELGTGLAFLLVTVHYLGGNYLAIEYFRNLFFVALLTVIFVYDLKYQIILPGLIWLGGVVGLFLNIKYLGADPYTLAFGAIIGGGFFLVQYLVSKGKWIGGGDVRLGFMMGAWLGWKGVLVALFISYISGAIVGVSMIAFKKKEMSSAVPFGTFLSAGTLLALLWGEPLLRWYLGLF